LALDYVADDDGEVTGSIGASRRATNGVDHDFDLSDKPATSARPAANASQVSGDAAIRMQEDRFKPY